MISLCFIYNSVINITSEPLTRLLLYERLKKFKNTVPTPMTTLTLSLLVSPYYVMSEIV